MNESIDPVDFQFKIMTSVFNNIIPCGIMQPFARKIPTISDQNISNLTEKLFHFLNVRCFFCFFFHCK